jgi:ABC-type glycerol-3-phosphate transport system substrate-binding protein
MRQHAPNRRSVLRAALAGAGAAVTGACAPEGPDAAGGEAPPAGVQPGVRVSFAATAPPDQAAVAARAARAVAQRVPGLAAEFVNTQGQHHTDKVTAAMAGGTPIDVFTLNPAELVPFADKGRVRALDDLIRRDRYDVADFFERCFDQFRWRGRAYALPLDFASQDVYYGTALWDAAGLQRPPYDWRARDWTAQEFLDAARRLARLPAEPAGPAEAIDGGRERRPPGAGAGPGVWGWQQGTALRQWAPWVWSFGGDVLDPHGTRCVLDQPPAVEGLQFLQDLIHTHRVMPPPADGVDAVAALGSGRLGMALGVPALAVRLRQVRGLAFDVAPMPRRATRLTSGGGLGWHLAAGTPHVNEAWALQQWLASREVQTWLCELGGAAPARRSLSTAPCSYDRTAPSKGADVFLQAPEFVHLVPQAPGWTEALEILNAGLASLWDGSKTARQVTREVVPPINRLLKERAGRPGGRAEG